MRRALLVFLCLLLFLLPVHAAGDTIQTLTLDVQVAGDGTVSVTATAQVNFTSAPTTFAFPLNAKAGDIVASGASYTTERRSGVEYAVFSNPGGFIGQQTFVCTYSMPCAAVKTEEGQQFQMNVIDGGWDYSISSFTLNATFTAPIPVQPTWDSAFHGEVIDNSLTIKVTDNVLTVRSVQAIMDHETIQMGLAFPADTFHIVHQAGRTLSFSQIAFYVILGLALIYWFFRLRRRLIFAGHNQALSSDATAGELPCLLFGEAPDVAATIAQWGDLGYVSFHRGRNRRLTLYKQMEMGNERKDAELRLFHAIFRSGDSCDAGSRRFQAAVHNASGALRTLWLRRVFRKKPGNPFLLRTLTLLAGFFLCMTSFDILLPETGTRWVLLPLLSLAATALCYGVQYGYAGLYRRNRNFRLLVAALCAVALFFIGSTADLSGLMIVNILAQVLAVGLTMFGGRRTKGGDDHVRQVLGLRHYLQHMDGEDALQLIHRDNQYFYRMLPYAEALGVGAQFSRKFTHWRPEPCAWMSDASFRPSSATEFYALYTDLLRVIRNEPVSPLHRR